MKLNKRIENLIANDKGFDEQQDKILRDGYKYFNHDQKAAVDDVFICLTGLSLEAILSLKNVVRK